MARARALAGRSLAAVAADHSVAVPPDLRRAKGWVGQLIERALGATASSRAAPDFESLGIELKTLPVDARGKPVESTFVCTIPLSEMPDTEWTDSRVRSKLDHVLWVVVDGRRSVPVGERRIGAPLLWRPTPEEDAALRFDFEELAGLVARGRMDDITGKLGRCLQIRPKGRNAAHRRGMVDEDGERSRTLPRGFYLRATFTAGILQRSFRLPSAEGGEPR